MIGGKRICFVVTAQKNRNTNLLTELRKRFADVRIGLYEEADTLIYVLSVPGQEGNDRKTIRVNQEEQQKISELHGYTNRHNMQLPY